MPAPGPVIDAKNTNVVALRGRGDRLQLAENRIWACVDADVTEEAHGRSATEDVAELTHELSGTKRVPRSRGCKQRNLFGEDYPRARMLAAAEAPDPQEKNDAMPHARDVAKNALVVAVERDVRAATRGAAWPD
jgi:hypothetical protein